MLIDTHCHLDFDRFDPDRDEVVARAAANGVTRLIIPAIDRDNCPTVLRLAEQYDGVFAAVGVHPNSSADWQDSWIDDLRQFAQHPKVVAIGEIGLDYYWKRSPQEVQHRAFSAQLALAHELGLPVIVHNRESDEDVVRLLRQSPLNGLARPGVLHSFSTTWEIAQQVLDMGFYLGFTGPLTFKQADELRRVAGQVPLDRLLVETDAPFLAPQQKRGQRNEPAYVAYVAERLAAVRNLDVPALEQQTTENALRLFGNKLNR
ncbi:MAG: TatD family hydrolase [Chloroflexi bacterium]|nr:TatD family hydrolase [Chloroflexota bacterium]MBP8057169.1 TatD family hydrolase [Chloroflexota bacterium]